MKVLVVHNAYQQSAGEDRVVAAEIKQLAAHGDSGNQQVLGEALDSQ